MGKVFTHLLYLERSFFFYIRCYLKLWLLRPNSHPDVVRNLEILFVVDFLEGFGSLCFFGGSHSDAPIVMILFAYAFLYILFKLVQSLRVKELKHFAHFDKMLELIFDLFK